jgi:hypothetical protein
MLLALCPSPATVSLIFGGADFFTGLRQAFYLRLGDLFDRQIFIFNVINPAFLYFCTARDRVEYIFAILTVSRIITWIVRVSGDYGEYTHNVSTDLHWIRAINADLLTWVRST